LSDVFLHVGLPKTGTTTIQSALTERVDVLTAAGVLYPGGRRLQRLAAFDLLGQRVPGDDAIVAGAFNRLVAEVAPYGGPRVLVSEEELGLCRPRHVRRFVRALDGHRVHVVIGVRDLGRTLVSAWQQSVVMGATTTWTEFVSSIRDPSSSPTRTAAGFAARHDVLRVLDAWGTQVPHERIRLVTVPPRGSPGDILLDRFARATDLPPRVLADGQPVRNVSLGAAEVEVIRRMNEQLAGRLAARHLRHVIQAGIRPELSVPCSRSLRLPAEDAGWVRERGEQVIEELRRRGHLVYGDLVDLQPIEPDAPGRRLDDVSQAELLEATESALAALAIAHGNLSRRHQRRAKHQPLEPGLAERLKSDARAVVFRLQKAILTHAEHHPLLAWAVRRFLSRGPHPALDTGRREKAEG
jgi:hypothetical protein